jgi:hypothetical protein
MAQLIPSVTYRQIKRITDWQLTEETQRSALALVVNAIANLDTSKTWGEGKTSASDGQRFAFRAQVLQQTYSHKFSDFAIEFYSFVADNYAPFYGVPIECNERDAPYVLDGVLYNESDLSLEEHYTDTHGYTEINFAAFAAKTEGRALFFACWANGSVLAFANLKNNGFIESIRIMIMALYNPSSTDVIGRFTLIGFPNNGIGWDNFMPLSKAVIPPLLWLSNG